MPLEIVNWIQDLVATNPVGATDPKSEGDDHIRNIKTALLANFPSLGTFAVKMSATQLNSFTGMIAPFASNMAEGALTGWLRCNGQSVLRADYPDLYAAIGVIYGLGNGVDDFIVPDYRGKFLRDQDECALNDPDVALRVDYADAVVGDVVGSEQGFETGPHDHPVVDPGHNHPLLLHQENGNNGGRIAVTSSVNDYPGSTQPAVTGITLGPVLGLETRPINVSVRYMIHI